MGELIGQFGVGFYSSFMVSKKVELTTRRAGQKTATRWESDGKGDYSIEKAERETSGTSITLHLEPVDEEQGLEDFTDEHVLSRIIRRYSDFIAYPIVLRVEDGEDETLNSMKPIWERVASDVTDEEYGEFYKHISHDWRDPLERILQRAEGLIEYKALLFIPSEAPVDLYFVGHESGLRLYVKRVSIMEHCEELLPRYLRFMQGVVDSADLPLNVSREILQHDRQIRQIRKGLQKKVLDTFQKMKADDEEKYLKFWTPFGRALKEGVAEDFENRDKLVDLLLFASSQRSREAHFALGLRRTDEGRSGRHLLHDRRESRGDRELAAPRSVPRQGRRGPLPDRRRRRVARADADRVQRQEAPIGGEGYRRPRHRRRKRRSRRKSSTRRRRRSKRFSSA